MKKSVICAVALANFLSFTASSLSVFAADVPVGSVSYQDSTDIALNIKGSSDEDLLYNYMLQRSGVKPVHDKMKNGKNVTYESGVTAGSKLTGIDANVYEYLKTEIQKIASGERTSTNIEIPFSVLGVKEGPWSASELGISDNYSYGWESDAINAAMEKTGYNTDKVMNALIADLPYDLYWCDKTSYSPMWDYSYSTDWNNGECQLYFKQFHSLILYVSTDYSVNGAKYTTTFPAERTSAVNNAISNAQSIVNELSQSRSGKELLAAYRDRICALTTYNYDAINNDADYGDPWQLINVFDGDSSTNVVCEGYAKAFKYLCDLSADKLPGISCLIATGTTTGLHMWNVVNMDDNRSYLVDITACDSMDDYVEAGSTAPSEFTDTFFLSVPSSGTYNSTYRFDRAKFRFRYKGYYYSMPAETYYYTYDDDTLSTFDSKYLKLSSIPYTAYTYVPAVAPTCDTDGNIEYYIDGNGDYYLLSESGSYIETDAESVALSKTGHDWSAATYTWNGLESVTASCVCMNNAGHKKTETVNVSNSITKAATCTENGERTYTAVFTDPAFTKQKKTRTNVPATGHSYGNANYIWAADGSSCTATAYCEKCSAKLEKTASVSSEILTPANYTSKGWTRYTAMFSDTNFSTQIKDIQDIPMLVGTEVVIELSDINGFKTYSTVLAEIFSGFELPSTYYDGYNFVGWTINGILYETEASAQSALNEIVSGKPAEPVKLSVKYEKKAESYSVSVKGGKLSNCKISDIIGVSELVTVMAGTMSGKKFSHWLKNGVIVSCNSTYSFYMPSENVELTAVFTENPVEPTGVASIESVNVNGSKLSFVSVLSVPKNGKFVKGGLVATSNSNIGGNVNAENAEYVKLSTKATANTKNLKYTWNKNVTGNTVWYVRAYLVYSDSSGIEHTVYSGAVAANKTV